MDMTWRRLILLSLSNDQKTLSRPKWCQPLVIEPVHLGSIRILLVHFLGHPVDDLSPFSPLNPENKEIDCSYVLHCVHLDKPLLCAQHQWAETVSSGIAITGKASLVSGQRRMTEEYDSGAAILNLSKICRTK